MSELVDRDSQSPRAVDEPLVIAGELHDLAVGAKEFDGGQVQGIQRADRRTGKGSSALARTGGAISIKATRPSSARTSSPWVRPSLSA